MARLRASAIPHDYQVQMQSLGQQFKALNHFLLSFVMRKSYEDQCLLLLTEFTQDYFNLEMGSINHKAQKGLERNGSQYRVSLRRFTESHAIRPACPTILNLCIAGVLVIFLHCNKIPAAINLGKQKNMLCFSSQFQRF